MQQFDVVRDKRSKDGYFLVLQSDLLDHASTVIVAPVVETDEKFPASVPVLLGDRRRVAIVPQMAAIRRSECGETMTNISRQNGEIIEAIDLIFSGY